MTSKLNILLPIEIEKRELDYKLFLASMIVNRDNKVYIGQHNYLYDLAKNMRNGIYVGKNLFSIDRDGTWFSDKYFKLNENKIKLVHLDEEGGIMPGSKTMWNEWLTKRIDLHSIKNNDYICTWGDFQKNFYRENTMLNEKHILTTGHPRLDLPTKKYNKYYSKEVGEIEAKYGEFVLINSTFTRANNCLGIEDTFSPRMRYEANDKIKSKIAISRWAYAAKTQAEYMNALFQLSMSHPNTNFIFRPHPSESHVIYNAIFKKSKNVHIEGNGSVIPWLLACKLLVHDGCTTAVEGFVAGTNIINYQPFYLEELDYIMVNGIGKRCTTKDDLYTTVNNVLKGELSLNSLSSCAEDTLSVLHNLKNNREIDSLEMCSDLILRCQNEIDSGTEINYTKSYLSSVTKYMVNSAKNTIRPIFRDKHKEYMAYKSHFTGFNQTVVESKFNLIKNMLNKDISFKYINKSLIVISA